ncbi:MAG TPA: lipocalin-like domain-containing protein [Burkholderiales bacterium]|nr:lipocalin-like domain-containing protein [Burkholderiales bacterium]
MRRLVDLMLSLTLCVLALAATTVHSQTKNPLMGAWKVTEIANPDGPPLTSPQAGLYLFTEKHYSAVRLNGSKPLPSYPSNDVATDADKVAVFNMLYMNTGSYTVSGNKLTLSPTVAKSAFAMEPGRTLEYEFTVKGDTLTLVQKPKGPGLKFVRVE